MVIENEVLGVFTSFDFTPFHSPIVTGWLSWVVDVIAFDALTYDSLALIAAPTLL
jgi:hypothetical protein